MSTTYNAQVYMEQGATKLVCTTGGEIEMRTGSLFDQQSGSTMSIGGALKSTGTVKVQAGGDLADQNYELLTDTSTTISTRGFSRLYCAAVNTFELAAPPYAGISKHIMCWTTLLIKVRSAVPLNFATGPTRIINFTGVGPTSKSSTDPEKFPQGVSLYGVTTALWAVTKIMGTTKGVTFTSST